MATFATDETGEFILSIVIMTVIIFISALIAFTVMKAGPDSICLFNSQVADLITWDSSLIETKTNKNYLCNQWKETKIIDADVIQCEAFIDYDLTECPHLDGVCDSVNVRDVSGGCIDKSMVSEGFTDREEFLLQYCEYQSFCSKYKNSEKYPQKAKLVTERYVAQELGRYAERCVYMSNENDKFVVPCFSLSVKGFDYRIRRDFTIETLKYTESTYAKSEVAYVDPTYFRFGHVSDNIDGSECMEFNSDSKLIGLSGAVVNPQTVVHEAEAAAYFDTSKDIKMVWLPDDMVTGGATRGHYLGIMDYTSGCKVTVEQVLRMDDHFKDA